MGVEGYGPWENPETLQNLLQKYIEQEQSFIYQLFIIKSSCSFENLPEKQTLGKTPDISVAGGTRRFESSDNSKVAYECVKYLSPFTHDLPVKWKTL